MSARKPVSFWREKRDTVVILYEALQKCCHVKTSQENGSSFGLFRSAKISVTINRNKSAIYTSKKELDINFLSIFTKNGQSNLELALVRALKSKGPYCDEGTGQECRNVELNRNL